MTEELKLKNLEKLFGKLTPEQEKRLQEAIDKLRKEREVSWELLHRRLGFSD